MNYVFKQFADDACERYRAIVCDIAFIALFEERGDEGEFPVVWNDAFAERVLKEDSEGFMKFLRADF